MHNHPFFLYLFIFLVFQLDLFGQEHAKNLSEYQSIKKRVKIILLLNQKPNQGGIGMADVNATVQNAAAGIVGVIKALIVLFVFVNIIYSTGFDPIGGIVDLVNTFLDGGFAGLLALLVFLSFLG